MNRTYACIDLKSFYASVECVERKLDPLTTNLVVADKERTEKTICLAITPSLKSYGLGGRARLYEVVEKVKEDFLDEESEEDAYKTDEERRAETALKAAIEAADAAQKAADLANIMVEEARVHMLEVRKVTKQQQADEAEAEGNQELARSRSLHRIRQRRSWRRCFHRWTGSIAV